MRFAALVLVLLAGCQRLLGLQPVHLTDGSRAPDAPDARDARDGGADGPSSMLLQEVAAASQSSTLTVSLDHPPAASHVLIAIGGAENGVKDIYGGGVVWKLAASSIISPTIQIWYGETDGSSSSITVDGNAGKIWVEVSEWRGLATTGTFDAGSGRGAIVSTTTDGTVSLEVNTQAAPDLLIFGVASFGPIGTPAGSWTPLKGISSSFITQDAWYELVPTPGMQAVQTTYRADYDAALAALRTMP